MTYKNGFVIGFITGFVAWLITGGYLVFLPAPYVVSQIVLLIAVILFIGAVLFSIYSAFRRGSVIDPTVDGAIYGFVCAFDLLYIASAIMAGQLPLPI